MIVEIRDEVVALSGMLRRNHWPTLESAVNVRLKHHPAGIVVDCSGLIGLTLEGADTFRNAASHIARGGARIVLANVPPDVMAVIRQVPNLRSQLPIAETVAAARASLGLETRVRTGAAGDSTHDVVAGLLGTEADPHAVAVACRLGQPLTSRVYLTYVLVVPRNMPLLSALGPEEEKAQSTLERLDGAVRLARLQPVPRVERTRDPATRLIEVAGETRAESIVLALPPGCPEDLVALAQALLARAPCDVVINRLSAPETAAARAPAPALVKGGVR